MKSKIKSAKAIPWDTVLKLEKLQIDPQILKMHSERINKVFNNAPEEIRNQQIHNIVVRDNLFNKAMDIITTCYEFDINDEDVKAFEEAVIKNFGEEKRDVCHEIAIKLVKKTLIFQDLQEKLGIVMEDAEIKKVLDDYYQATNKPIRGILEDKEKYQGAKSTLLEEKIIATIIQKFPRDLTVLEANMKKAYEEHQRKAATSKVQAEDAKKEQDTTVKTKSKRK